MKYQINSNKTLFTQLGEEGVLYDTENNEFSTLNETFLKILKGIEQHKDIDEITDSLVEEYDISRDRCLAEVKEAIRQLEKKGLISIKQ